MNMEVASTFWTYFFDEYLSPIFSAFWRLAIVALALAELVALGLAVARTLRSSRRPQGFKKSVQRTVTGESDRQDSRGKVPRAAQTEPRPQRSLHLANFARDPADDGGKNADTAGLDRTVKDSRTGHDIAGAESAPEATTNTDAPAPSEASVLHRFEAADAEHGPAASVGTPVEVVPSTPPPLPPPPTTLAIFLRNVLLLHVRTLRTLLTSWARTLFIGAGGCSLCYGAYHSLLQGMDERNELSVHIGICCGLVATGIALKAVRDLLIALLSASVSFGAGLLVVVVRPIFEYATSGRARLRQWVLDTLHLFPWSIPGAAILFLCSDAGGRAWICELGASVLGSADAVVTAVMTVTYHWRFGLLPAVAVTLGFFLRPKSTVVVITVGLAILLQPVCSELCTNTPWCKEYVVDGMGAHVGVWGVMALATLAAVYCLLLVQKHEQALFHVVVGRLGAAVLGGGIAVAAGYTPEAFVNSTRVAGGVMVEPIWTSAPTLLLCFVAGRVLMHPLSYIAARTTAVSGLEVVHIGVGSVVLAAAANSLLFRASGSALFGEQTSALHATIQNNQEVIFAAFRDLLLRVAQLFVLLLWFHFGSSLVDIYSRPIPREPQEERCSRVVSKLLDLVFTGAFFVGVSWAAASCFGPFIGALLNAITTEAENLTHRPPGNDQLLRIIATIVVVYGVNKFVSVFVKTGLRQYLWESFVNQVLFMATFQPFNHDLASLESIGTALPQSSLTALLATTQVVAGGIVAYKLKMAGQSHDKKPLLVLHSPEKDDDEDPDSH